MSGVWIRDVVYVQYCDRQLRKCAYWRMCNGPIHAFDGCPPPVLLLQSGGGACVLADLLISSVHGPAPEGARSLCLAPAAPPPRPGTPGAGEWVLRIIKARAHQGSGLKRGLGSTVKNMSFLLATYFSRCFLAPFSTQNLGIRRRGLPAVAQPGPSEDGVLRRPGISHVHYSAGQT